MHKLNSTSHLKTILSDVISIGYEHMQSLALELKKLDITDSNIADKSVQDTNRAQLLSHVLTLLNDVLHPAHDVSLELFPDAEKFIGYCIANQKIAIEKKLIAPNCNCYSCKTKLKC